MHVHFRIEKGKDGMPPVTDAMASLQAMVADPESILYKETVQLKQGPVMSEPSVGPLETEAAMQSQQLWNGPKLHVSFLVEGDNLATLSGDAFSDSLAVYLRCPFEGWVPARE